VTDARIGELAGLATAALWVVSSLSFTAAGRRLGATRVNLLRTLGAAVVLAFVQWMWFGQWLPRTEVAAMLWLACSGLLGLTIGDQFLFSGYVMLGPRTVSLLMTLSPSLAATIAWVCFGEGMTGISVLGMLITTGGVAWVTLGRQEVVADRDARTVRKGLLFGLAAAVCQALGMVMARRGDRKAHV
jgi:drug/metabolite transporter (DMT)-like permease